MYEDNNKGITLIALVLTVAVMLIITGVTLGMILDNNFFNTSKEVVNNINQKSEESINQENQITNDWWSSPGESIKTDNLTEEGPFTINVETSEIGESSATITASIEETIEDLQYILEINGKTYGPNTTGVWEITNLDKGRVKGTKYNTTANYTDVRGKTAKIPEGFTVLERSSENLIDGGLVIYLIPDDDTENTTDTEIVYVYEPITYKYKITVTNGKESSTKIGTLTTEVTDYRTIYDQFVWIPVDDINDIYMCQSEGTDVDGSGVIEVDEYDSCRISLSADSEAICTTHNSTLMAGRLYGTGTNSSDTIDLEFAKQTYNANEREPDILTDTDATQNDDGTFTYLSILDEILKTSYTTVDEFKNDLQTEYNEIVKSVYSNTGFYVGRYETSGTSTTDGDVATIVAGAKPSTSLSWYYLYAQQVDYATNTGITSVGSTMIQGAAYDQIMRFLAEDGTDIINYGNRAGYGSTYFSQIPYQTGGKNYYEVYSGDIEYKDILKNIYDLEGNCDIFTTEGYSNTHRVWRSSNVYAIDSISRRYISTGIISGSDAGASLILLYIK